jgi:hypothetical protein
MTQWEVKEKQQRKMLVKLGKRRAREESNSPEIMHRDRSMTLVPQEPSLSHQAIERSIEGPVEGQSQSLRMIEHLPEAARLPRGKYTAIRGGKSGSKHVRH